MEKTGNILEFSAISITEMAIEASLGKPQLTAAIARQALQDLAIRVLPYGGDRAGGDHALRLFELPLHHADPFDRQIIAGFVREDPGRDA